MKSPEFKTGFVEHINGIYKIKVLLAGNRVSYYPISENSSSCKGKRIIYKKINNKYIKYIRDNNGYKGTSLTWYPYREQLLVSGYITHNNEFAIKTIDHDRFRYEEIYRHTI